VKVAFFFVGISKSKFSKTGYSVELRFSVSQHSKDHILINSLTNFFKCGIIMKMGNKSMVEFRVSSFKNIMETVIPFFFFLINTHYMEQNLGLCRFL